MDDMILDMDTFDFSQIDSDLVIVNPDGSPVEVDEPVEVEEEIEVEEVEADEVEEVEEDEEVELDPDGEDVDFESYEITLPTGEAVVLSELVSGFKNAEEVRKEREHVESIKADFETKSGNLANYLELAQLEVDSVIAEYGDTDWDELASEDPAAYSQHRQYLDKHVKRSKELKAAMTDLHERKAQEAQVVEQEKVRNAVVRLQREITGWGDNMYRSLVEYGMSLGGNQEELLNTTDPLVFIALHKAHEAEKGKIAVKAKVKQIGSPKKVVKATAKKAPVSQDAKRDALMKKAQAEGDHAALFQFIKD